MSNSALFDSDAARYFPRPSKEDVVLFDSLPEAFCLDVPYIAQESIHGSGTACLRMLAAFQGLDPAKGLELTKEAEADWKSFNHETLAEDFARAMLRVGLLPYEYYPGRFVLPAFEEGYLGADFIAMNFGEISKIDQLLMKSAIFGSRTPIFARVHFDTDEYAMPDEVATVLDTSGHGVVLCGWNEEGFLVHDPWPRERFGGYGGGD